MLDNPETRRRFWLWIALLGAIVCSSASWIRFLVVGDVGLREAMHDPILRYMNMLAGVGLVILGASAVATYRSADRRHLREILACSLSVHACMLLALPLHSTDLFSYLAYGEITAHGLNPHLVVPAAFPGSSFIGLTTWAQTPSVYGPVADLAMGVAGHVGRWTGSPIWAAGVCYKFLVGVLDIASVLLVYSMARSAQHEAAVRGFVLFSLSPVLAWEVAAQSHNDGMVVAFTVFYLWIIQRSRYSPLAVVSLVLGTLSKFVLAPTLALHIRAIARTDLRRAALLVVVVFLVAAAAYAPFWSGPETLAAWLRPLGATNGPYHASSMFTAVAKILQRVHAADSTVNGLYVAYVWTGRLILLGLSLVLFWRVRTNHGITVASYLVLLCALATTAALAPWYFVWLLPFAAVLRDRRWQGFTLALSVIASPTGGLPHGWLIFPFVQVAMLVALSRWAFAFPWARRAPRRSAALASRT